MDLRGRAELVLLGVTLAWGGSFLVVKGALDELGTHWLLVLRFALAAAALAAGFGRRAFDLGRDPGGRTPWRPVLAIAALLWAGFALQTAGLTWTTPARSGFITATYVGMVPLLARLVLGRALSWSVGLAVSVALGGLYLLTDPRGSGVNLGDGLTLLGALAFAAHMLALDRYARVLPTPALALAQLAGVAGVSLPLALMFEPAPTALSAGTLAAIGYLALVCSAGAFLGQTWGQRHTSPTRAALIFSLESLFAALLSVAAGAEFLTPLQWFGGLLLVSGVVAGELAPAPR